MRIVRRLGAAALVLPLLICLGCQCIQEEVDEDLICLRNYADSWYAWIYYRHNCPDETWYPIDYGKGFREGYRNVAGGGDGCPPTLPPQCYWSVCFQNPIGQAKVQEWFRGFVFGANAAKLDGVAEYSQIMTSQRLFGRCGPQGSAGDVQYSDHISGFSTDGTQLTPTPTPTPATGDGPPPVLPGAEIPTEPYFPEETPVPAGPRAESPQQELLQLLQSPDGPTLQ